MSLLLLYLDCFGDVSKLFHSSSTGACARIILKLRAEIVICADKGLKNWRRTKIFSFIKSAFIDNKGRAERRELFLNMLIECQKLGAKLVFNSRWIPINSSHSPVKFWWNASRKAKVVLTSQADNSFNKTAKSLVPCGLHDGRNNLFRPTTANKGGPKPKVPKNSIHSLRPHLSPLKLMHNVINYKQEHKQLNSECYWRSNESERTDGWETAW